MGCTSSAPNMAYPSTAEKSIQFEEQIIDSSSPEVEEIIYRTANNTNVLPTSCDNLPEPVHIVRNKSTNSLNYEKENSENTNIMETNIKPESNHEHNEKIPRLEEVVDKVVQLHVKPEVVDDTPVTESSLITEEHPKIEEKIEKHSLESNNATEITEVQIVDTQEKEEEEPDEEVSSPAQSESSRATRWEALADIAAELPPSLTVDPITGQIYSLSKSLH